MLSFLNSISFVIHSSPTVVVNGNDQRSVVSLIALRRGVPDEIGYPGDCNYACFFLYSLEFLIRIQAEMVQSNRKGSREWRKNIDMKDVEEYVDDKRVEEMTG